MDASQSCKANILYTSGIHPYFADEMEFQIAKDALADSFKRSDVVGVGPIGLDYSTRCTVDPSKQISIFTEQVKLAVKVGKPLLVHIRPELRYTEGHKKAVKDAATVLSAECPNDYKICIHAYAGANDTLLTLMKLFSNLYVSFSSIITFSKAKHIREVAFDM
jgi:TatD DNase family protein